MGRMSCCGNEPRGLLVLLYAAVLVGDQAPAPDRDRLIGRSAVRFLRIDVDGLDLAAVTPVVAEVEHVLERGARAEAESTKSRASAVDHLRLELADRKSVV